jgi:exodeoxyribonuclease-3
MMGDFNIAHEPIDLARPKQNEKNAGYLPEERAWFTRFTKLGWVDVFRKQNPDLEGAYTWWSYRGGARERNVGWRLDYVTANKTLAPKLGKVHHHTDIMGSDHCPVSVSL